MRRAVCRSTRRCAQDAKTPAPVTGRARLLAGGRSGGCGLAVRQARQTECLFEGFEGPEADGGLGRLAGCEHGDGRDAHDAVVHGGVRIGIDVELTDLDDARVLGGQLLDLGRDHAARTAPLGPEVHDHRLVALEHIGLERGVGDFGDVG